MVQKVAGIQGPPGIQGQVGSTGEQGERDLKGDEGLNVLLEYRELKMIVVNVARNVTRAFNVTMSWMYWLNIYRFNWRLDMVRKCLYQVSCIRG